jgi:hypothetical protein
MIPTIKKHKLLKNEIKRHKLSENTQEKPKKYKLINPQIIQIISNSEYYTSSFDDPIKGGFRPDDLTYRMSEKQKEEWVDFIINDDPRILKIKHKRNFVVLVLRNTENKNKKSIRYMLFLDQKCFSLGGDSDAEDKTEKKKTRLHNVSNKPRIKRGSKKKGRRK